MKDVGILVLVSFAKEPSTEPMLNKYVWNRINQQVSQQRLIRTDHPGPSAHMKQILLHHLEPTFLNVFKAQTSLCGQEPSTQFPYLDYKSLDILLEFENSL